MSEFEKFNAKMLAISVDSIWSHLAFAKDRKLVFPLLADFEPKGRVSQKYGVYNHGAGESARALFVINAQGVIWWSYLASDDVNPGADDILSALENLTHKAEA
jgi:peroxiredoxin